MEQKSTPISILARFEVVAPHMSSIQCMLGECPNSTQKSSKGEYSPSNDAVPMHKRSPVQENIHGDVQGGMCSEAWGKGRETATSTHNHTPLSVFFYKYFLWALDESKKMKSAAF